MFILNCIEVRGHFWIARMMICSDQNPHLKIYTNTVWLPQLPHCHCLPLGSPSPPFASPFAFSSVCAQRGLCNAGWGHKGDSSGLGQIISVLCHGQCLSKVDRKKGCAFVPAPFSDRNPVQVTAVNSGVHLESLCQVLLCQCKSCL